ncbi:MAG: hypothetical protein B6D35_07615 [Candidatus Brocadia sp. UTAMX2]|jgi:hypothetical protein|nr:MAG: hypothetical protein B6D35_07615 [Candidatus Brocadia sp. UTAMX2]
MDTQNQDDKLWGLITQRIEEEKCILILGPDIVPSETVSLNEQLKSHLEKEGHSGLKYYTDDEFFSFADETDKEYAFYDVQKFYEKLQPDEIHRKIAEIPFHLIISVSPDLLLKKTFDDKKLDYIFDYYNKEQNPQGFEKPTSTKPLIYNLFGNVEVEGSLIFTYDDLFDYLIAIFGRHELHQDLRQELKASRLILFLGFKFDKWYFKLILRLLNLHKGKLSHAGLKDRNLLPHIRNFYTKEFKINFLNYHGVEILDTIYKRCAEKGLLRTGKKPASAQPEIFISYSWGGESEQTVDKICDTFFQKGYRIIRDKEELGYKGNIKEFMQKIGKGKCVVVVISDKYLKSENCMYEMLEIKNKGDVYKRIYPMVLKDAKIYDEIDRIDYLKYWDDKVDALKKKIETIRDPVGKVGVYEKINQYADIRRIIDKITTMLRDMNTLKPEIHQGSNFETLINAIDAEMQEETGD